MDASCRTDRDASRDASEAAKRRPWEGTAILLVDLDAFFASVEQLDHPAWRGKPVIVGGSPEKRGVVSTASYEARAFGVHSAMPSAQAARLCPDAIWTAGNYPRYSEMSRTVMDIIWDETPKLQQVSIDEAFADVTPGRHIGEHPIAIAERIKRRVAKLGVTCSIGLGTTKTIAKIASDLDKPDGLVVVYPGDERRFLDPLPVGKISGIGPKSREKLSMYGIHTIGDLARADERFLHAVFGANALVMLSRARGEESSEVISSTPVKSVSNEQTFDSDLTERAEILAAIDMVAAKVGRRLRRKGLAGHTVTLKVRYRDLSIHTAQRTIAAGVAPIDDEHRMMPILHELLDEIWTQGIGLRLVGAGVSGFGAWAGQLSLFDFGEDGSARAGDEEKDVSRSETHRLAEATDKVKNRFGEAAVRYGRELRFDGRDTGTQQMGRSEDLGR